MNHKAEQLFKQEGDEGLFPNHTDKDIWMKGFEAARSWIEELLQTDLESTMKKRRELHTVEKKASFTDYRLSGQIISLNRIIGKVETKHAQKGEDYCEWCKGPCKRTGNIFDEE